MGLQSCYLDKVTELYKQQKIYKSYDKKKEFWIQNVVQSWNVNDIRTVTYTKQFENFKCENIKVLRQDNDRLHIRKVMIFPPNRMLYRYQSNVGLGLE